MNDKMERGEKTPDDLDRPDGNGLKANYEKHDVGDAELVERLESEGFRVEAWGIDMRDDDGADGIIYDDKMDFKVFDADDNLVGLVDVKVKSNPRYMGRFNERHYVHYYEHAERFDVPTFVAMFQVDYQSETVYDEFVFEVGLGGLHERVMSSESSDAVPQFPDGNSAVLIPHGKRQPFDVMLLAFEEEAMVAKAT